MVLKRERRMQNC